MLSTTTEYALRIMVVLAESGDKPMTSDRIASLTGVPADYSVKVLQMLARAGLVKAQRGRGGGFHAECDSGTTTLLDVVNAIDPLQRLPRCPPGDEGYKGRHCPLHGKIDEVIALIRERLGQTTLRGLVESSRGPALCHREPVESAVGIGDGP